MKRKRRGKHLCRNCGDKKAIFFWMGRPRADRQHDLCPRCFRSLLDSLSFVQEGQAA